FLRIRFVIGLGLETGTPSCYFAKSGLAAWRVATNVASRHDEDPHANDDASPRCQKARVAVRPRLGQSVPSILACSRQYSRQSSVEGTVVVIGEVPTPREQ